MDTLIDKLFFPSKASEKSLIRKFSGSQSFLRTNNSLFQNIPSEYQQELFENNLFSTDFNTAFPGIATKLNLHSLFRTFNHNLFPHIPKLSPGTTLMQEYIRLLSSPFDMVVDVNPDFGHLWESVSPRTMEKTCDSDKCPQKGSLADQLIVSLPDLALPVSKTHLNVTVSKKVLAPLTVTKKHTLVDCNLDQQLADRKTKELQKRSKKRRRRQKKGNSHSNKSANDQKIQVNCEVKAGLSPKVPTSDCTKENCDIVCDVTISHDSRSFQIVLPNVSSFVVTVESGGEDDSDWDTNSDAGWLCDDSEFQVSGLFVTSFTSTSLASRTPESDIPCDKELDLIQARLKEVNKNWDKSTENLETKEKSTPLVSFVPDDELVEIFPVEMCERKGEWEIYATERLRFRKRIKEIEEVLSPCLSQGHRAKIYHNLYQSVL